MLVEKEVAEEATVPVPVEEEPEDSEVSEPDAAALPVSVEKELAKEAAVLVPVEEEVAEAAAVPVPVEEELPPETDVEEMTSTEVKFLKKSG